MHINQAGSSTTIRIENANADFLVQAGSAGAGGLHLYDFDNSAYRAVLTNAGRLGVGTTSPSNLVHFAHGTDNTLLRLESGDSQARIAFDDNAGETHLGAVGSDTVMWQGSGLAETLRVANGGEVTKPRTPYFWAYNSSNYSWNNNDDCCWNNYNWWY